MESPRTVCKAWLERELLATLPGSRPAAVHSERGQAHSEQCQSPRLRHGVEGDVVDEGDDRGRSYIALYLGLKVPTNLDTMNTLGPRPIDLHHPGCPHTRVGQLVTGLERSESRFHDVNEDVFYEIDTDEELGYHDQPLLFAIKKELV